ncbi:Transposable element P transposase [Caligus rogercresseyi]|uniref:Transposable element P transposase n=1 Tax=Caligus rogercresseyi TaxID=217165 RepID=A0A7T8QT74_CALRO|nr:Transposable element P transposase [Caligus rogercresseyi]
MYLKNKAIKRLQQRKRTKSTTLANVEQIISAMEPYLTKVQHSLISIQLRATVGKVKRCYNKEFKTFAIPFYKFKFKLPAVSTIQSWMSKLLVNEGFCPNLLRLLELRCRSLEEKDRVCNLIVDEISLRKAVDFDPILDQLVGMRKNSRGNLIFPSSALVFLISGLKFKWRQSVAYFFVQNSMATEDVVRLTLDCIDKLYSIGLKVTTFSSDQGTNFSAMLNRLGVSKERPYFHHKEKKIFVFADMPHVIKSIRNCLLCNKIISSKGTANWKHIEDFYRRDKQQRLRLCPKLSDAHFNMSAFGAKMKVKYATQVLSSSVAAAIATYVNLGALDKTADETSDFCQRINDIFDLLNSSRKEGKTKFQNALYKILPWLSF